jgi:ectoine hydroxylase-related dioxygenase (phytanoyl-CoA dioxygenase family)
MDSRSYQKLVADAQDEISARDFVRRLSADRRAELRDILGTERILIQSHLYLRATRPNVAAAQENVGWHREAFYGPDMQYSVNLWTPIANVSLANTLRYVPDSHLIPDAEIATVSEPDPIVERFSAGHKVGLLYAPKRIVSGVDLAQHRPFEVPPGSVAIFSGQLIHGAAANGSAAIRFSVDFRVIAADNLVERKQHFASGKEYFEEL